MTSNTNTNATSAFSIDKLSDTQLASGLRTVGLMCQMTGKDVSADICKQAAKRLIHLSDSIKTTGEPQAVTQSVPQATPHVVSRGHTLNERGTATILHALDLLLDEGEELEDCGHFEGTTPPSLKEVGMLRASVEKFGLVTPATAAQLGEFATEYFNSVGEAEAEQEKDAPANTILSQEDARAADFIETVTGRKIDSEFVAKTMDGMPEFLRKMATTKPNPNGTLDERLAYICQKLAPIREDEVEAETEQLREFLNQAASGSRRSTRAA
jgi:hypothetical protein